MARWPEKSMGKWRFWPLVLLKPLKYWNQNWTEGLCRGFPTVARYGHVASFFTPRSHVEFHVHTWSCNDGRARSCYAKSSIRPSVCLWRWCTVGVRLALSLTLVLSCSVSEIVQAFCREERPHLDVYCGAAPMVDAILYFSLCLSLIYIR